MNNRAHSKLHPKNYGWYLRKKCVSIGGAYCSGIPLNEAESPVITWVQAGVPGGLVGGPRAYQDQFRGFKYHRVHARRDFFLLKKIDWRKARERELATFDENRRAVGMLNPMRDKK